MKMTSEALCVPMLNGNHVCSLCFLSTIFFFFLHLLLRFEVFLGQVGKATVRSQTQSSFLTHAHACQELASLLIS